MPRSAPDVKLTVKGINKLTRDLKRAGDDLAVQTIKDANYEAASTVAAVARSKVPVVSGALSRSIRPGKSARAGVVRAGGKRVPYANAIHWGWPRRHIAPTRFLTDAAHESEPVWIERFVRRLHEALENINERY